MKKILAIMLTFSLIMNSTAVAFAAPDVPSLPDAPSAPDAPDTPDEPDIPDLPDNYVPDPTPTPSPTLLPLPSPSPTPQPTAEPVVEASDSYTQPENTGEGSSKDGQVGDPEIITGDASATGVINNIGNTNSAYTPEYEGGISIANEDNGADSENTGSVTIVDDSTTTQTNDADLDNLLEVSTNTGDNSTSRNVGNSHIDTGDANTTGTIFNSVNTNVDGVTMSEFNIVDDHIGDLVLDFESNCISGCGFWDLSAQNIGNGSDSTNVTDVNLAVNDVTFQDNNADIDNELVLVANTGNNMANSNTAGNSEIETGDANVSGNIINIANNNFAGGVILGIVNIFGDLIGDIIFPEVMIEEYGFDLSLANIGNGSDSINLTDVDLIFDDQFNQMNQADIMNSLELEATTGGNMVSSNTDGDNSIVTGDIGIDVNVINIANANMIGGNWWIVIVNEAGNWIGQIFGLDTNIGNNIALSGGQAQVGSNGVINISNTDNASGSENASSVDAAYTSLINQTNVANINNDVTIIANTGGNSASRNTGGDSSIITGDADIVLNIVNFVNNNFIGGNVFLTIVNVFGNFIGDIIGPGDEGPSDDDDPSGGTGGGGGVADESSPGNGGSSSSPSSSSSSSSSSSTESSPSVGGAVLAAAFIGPDCDQLPNLSFSSILSNHSFADDVLAGDGSILGGNDEDTTVNLAWAILILPALLGGVLVRKYELLAKLAAAVKSVRS